MGIKVGKGKYDYSGVESLPKGARQPIEKPFHNSDSFRHGLYVIIEELDDYLICKGFDPNAKHPWTYHTVDVRKTIKVAKPPLLMRTPWEGDPVEMRVNGTLTDVTYVYDDDELGKRTASWFIAGVQAGELQWIDPPYFVGDAIMAVEVRQSGGFDGLRVEQGPRAIPGPVTTEAGGKLTWMDLNNGGRKWVPTQCLDPMAWDFDTAINDSDPGNYNFRLNNATPAAATFIYVNDEPLSGLDIGSIIDDLSFGDHVHLSDCDGVSMLFSVSGATTDGTGYWKIPVTHVSGTVSWPFGKRVAFKFIPSPSQCLDPMSWDFDTSTSDSDPGNYSFRLNSATPGSVTFIYVNDEPLSGLDIGSIIDDLHFGDHVHLSDCDGVSMLFKVSTAIAAIDGTGYWKIPVTHVSGTVSWPFGKRVAFKFIPKSSGGQWGKTSGTMTARTGNTALGSGSVILSTGTAGTINQTGGTVTAYNGSSASVASGKWVYVVKRQTGEWDLIMESCG